MSLHGLYYERSEAFARLYRIVLVGAFIFLNILTPVALAKSVSLYYPYNGQILQWRFHEMFVLGNSSHSISLEYCLHC